MKRSLLLTLAITCCVGFISAQTNLNLENWTPNGFGGEDPDGWSTLNGYMISGFPQTTFKETASPGEGSASAKMLTQYIPGASGAGAVSDTVGGMLFIGSFNLTTQENGLPYTQTPTSIDFIYKENLMGSDSAMVLVQLTHFDVMNGLTITDGIGSVSFGGQSTSWNSYNLPIQYFTGDTPDTLKIICTSSAIMLGSAVGLQTPGSEFYVDSFAINLIPVALSVFVSSTNACFGSCNGTATAIAGGGDPPYTYSWSDPGSQTTATATGLCPGSYTVFVYDAFLNSAFDVVSVIESAQITGVTSSTDDNGTCNGTATIAVTGGVTPYTYLWSTFPAQTNTTATGLCTGTYTVMVTDANGCTYTSVVFVTSVGCNLTVTTTSTDETSAGANDGTATANALNGTLPYTYMWNTTPTQTTQTATGLPPGVYTVIVTDADTCTTTTTVLINAASSCNLNLTIITNDETGNGANDGSATAVVTNGANPYTYLWSNAQTTSTAMGLAPGVYTLTVLDADSCFVIGTAVIQAFQCSFTGSMLSTDETSAGAGDGTASVVVGGGTSPYSYIWNTGGTTTSITGLSPAVYSVTVTDADSCTYMGTVSVNAPGCNLIITMSGTAESQDGANDGTAMVNILGGISPITILWSTTETTTSINNLAPGTYSVTVTDSLGCIEAGSYTVTAGMIVGIGNLSSTIRSFKVYPNPTTEVVYIEYLGYGFSKVSIFNLAGEELEMVKANDGITSIDVSPLPRGMYFYRLVSETGEVESGKFLIAK